MVLTRPNTLSEHQRRELEEVKRTTKDVTRKLLTTSGHNETQQIKEQLKGIKRLINGAIPGTPEEQKLHQQIQALESELNTQKDDHSSTVLSKGLV